MLQAERRRLSSLWALAGAVGAHQGCTHQAAVSRADCFQTPMHGDVLLQSSPAARQVAGGFTSQLGPVKSFSADSHIPYIFPGSGAWGPVAHATPSQYSLKQSTPFPMGNLQT